ncbi:MAG: hypothetical protein H7A35_04490 [Planctomycetales bacterium]|nr:hypothetical protein [bacterium]UNM09316.1 MAG: hypothetical protein H7A35_04490 [Planctomycetales bacterium]
MEMQGEAVGSLYYLMLVLAALLLGGGIWGLIAGSRSGNSARGNLFIALALVALLAGSALGGFLLRHSLPHS